MRIVVWNCSRGPLAAKLAALESLQPDLEVVSEAPAPPTDQVLWFRAGAARLGVQVRAHGEYKLERLVAADLPNCVNPVRVLGRTPFNLLAVWTWPAPTYVKAFTNALDAYETLLRGSPTVVAGDFNGNPTYDKPRQWEKWGNAFSRLNELGAVSAYHHARGVAYGQESDPTHHFRRKADNPFHTDFCFVPIEWTKRGVGATVGSGSPWNLIGDHFPITVDVAGI